MYANKMILSMSSPVIKAMFESDFKEKNETEIKLPEKKLNTFLELMQAVHPKLSTMVIFSYLQQMTVICMNYKYYKTMPLDVVLESMIPEMNM